MFHKTAMVNYLLIFLKTSFKLCLIDAYVLIEIDTLNFMWIKIIRHQYILC
jgi:hypothetical protein